MTERVFDNVNNVPQEILQMRILRLDPGGKVRTYDSPIVDIDTRIQSGIAHYVTVDSILSDDQIQSGLYATTVAELAAITREQNAVTEAKLATAFKTLTPAQAEAYIDANVTTLASAKAVLRIMARIIIAMRDQLWADLPDL